MGGRLVWNPVIRRDPGSRLESPNDRHRAGGGHRVSKIRSGRTVSGCRLSAWRFAARCSRPAVFVSTLLSLGFTFAGKPAGPPSEAFYLELVGDRPKVFEGRNPNHSLRAEFTGDGLRVSPLVSSGGGWAFELRLTGYGPDGAIRSVQRGTLRATDNRADIDRGDLTEWYVNGPHGIEQGFSLHEPEGAVETTLALEMMLSGDLVPIRGGNGRWIDLVPRGKRFGVMRYGNLEVTDANGDRLPAALELDVLTLRIVIDARGAVYPINVDPLLTHPAWSTRELDDSHSIAWGDWDQDGDLDLAVGNQGQPNRIYRNNNGKLILHWSADAVRQTASVAWGDGDGDGDLDLAVGNLAGPNEIYENTGKWFRLVWSSDESDDTRAVAWGDWDGDGDLDLAAGNLNQANRIYENTGGTMQLARSFGEGDQTASLAWGDLDRDGDNDLLVGNLGGSNRLYRHVSGELLLAFSFDDTDDTTAVAFGDWDADRDLDIFFGNDGQPNRVFRTIFGPLMQGWVSDEADATTSIALGDLDGDGDLDLVVGNRDQPNRLYRRVPGSFELEWSSETSDTTGGVALGDCDGDGDLDLAEANAAAPNKVSIAEPGVLSDSWTGPIPELTNAVAWGDWDGDGDLDLAVGNKDQAWNGFVGGIEIFENNDGNLSLAWMSAERDNIWALAWGDWDGDGDLDLATGNALQPNRVYENTGGALSLAWSSVETGQTKSVAWADVDDDGDLDLAFGNLNGSIWLYENTGGDLVRVWESEERDATFEIAWGDWDNDGDLDLAVANSGHNRVYRNRAGSLSLAWSSPESDGTESIAWGDWDGDGDLDLATGEFDLANRVYENVEGRDLVLAWSSQEIDDTTTIAWGDWDGDGDLDLAVGNLWLLMRIYENTGGALRVLQNAGALDFLLESIAFADMDADGDLDLAAANRCPTIENRVYSNHRFTRGGALPDTPVHPVTVERPGETPAAFFFSSAERLDTSPVSVPFRLVDPESDRAWRVVGEYSLNGGGKWYPASEGSGGSGTHDLAASAGGTPHTFSWDIQADRACSDGAVFRISVVHQAPAAVGGPLHQGNLSSVTPPFRVGGPRIAWYDDADGDGHGDPATVRVDCWRPAGFAATADDCDPTNGLTYPGAPEIDDGRDNQCPGDPGYGQIDEPGNFRATKTP